MNVTVQWLLTVDDDLPLWKYAIDGESSVEIVVHDDLDHRFQRDDGPKTPEEYITPEHPFGEAVDDDLVTFVEAIDRDG